MRARRLSSVFVALASAALALAALTTTWSLPSLSRGHTNDVSAYQGSWQYADGERGLARIEAGVENAVRGMPFFVAPIARDIVRGRTAHSQEFHLEVQGELVRFRTERWGPVSSRLDGPPVRIVAPEGTRLEMIQRLDRGGRLVQRFNHPDGTRENTLALSGDGGSLWMSVRIYSPRLPHDCRYRLRYRRAGAR